MNIALWISQSLMALLFIYSGINKSLLPASKLVKKGQTGVDGLSPAFIRFIGISEILGSIGLVLPALLGILPFLTPVSALCMAYIMIPAGKIHYKRHEYKSILTNVVVFALCIFIAYGRINYLIH